MSKENLDKSSEISAYPYLVVQKIEHLGCTYYSILIFSSRQQYSCIYTSLKLENARAWSKKHAMSLSIPCYEVL